VRVGRCWSALVVSIVVSAVASPAMAIQGGTTVGSISTVPYVGRLTASHLLAPPDLRVGDRCGATLVNQTC
jgi:hypothetical protein